MADKPRFIRKNGRIIPIKGGSKPSGDNKSQDFGVTVGTSLGLGYGAARGKGMLKAGVLGALAGIIGGTIVGKSKADKKHGSHREFMEKRAKKNNMGF